MKAIFALLMLASTASAQDQPRVYIQTRSRGNMAAEINFSRWQKKFQNDCTDARISVVQSNADYTVILSHVGTHDQIDVANKNGDVLASEHVGGIQGGACNLILADWRKPQGTAPAQQQQPEQQPDSQPSQDQAPSQQAQPEPQTIQLGQTPDQVRTALGQPDKVVNLGAKQIYVYKDLKITFVNAKVSDVQ
jgi:hypothetical protein